MILTYIIETTVYGVRAYHWKCSCGAKGGYRDSEAQALSSARKHTARMHGNADVEEKILSRDPV